MPVIHFAGWPIADDAKAERLLKELTVVAHEITGAPLEKISAYISQIPPNRWADGGQIGRPPQTAQFSVTQPQLAPSTADAEMSDGS